MKLNKIIEQGYKPRKMIRTKKAGETWLLVKDLGIYLVWNHGAKEFTSPVLVGYLK